MPTEPPELIVADAPAWRDWLGTHHADPTGVWLVLAKRGTTVPTSLGYDEALEEALCHGWIDGQVRRRDEATYRQRFTPRRSRSPWSARNVGIVARLTAQERMHPAGLAEVDRARTDGRWDAAYAGQSTAEPPEELLVALAAEPRARRMFDLLTAQNRYAVIYRISSAKRAETRSRRIAQFVAMLARGETPHPQRRTPDDTDPD
ncbi:YdeI family protein [Micromonospora sp. NPDC005806]|uniref:YdeI/OmpD-associated family protein n=1 Tax=Micromonospora sp. NPDC005806 TaxID=3364234 RepID=UPI0036B75DA7